MAIAIETAPPDKIRAKTGHTAGTLNERTISAAATHAGTDRPSCVTPGETGTYCQDKNGTEPEKTSATD